MSESVEAQLPTPASSLSSLKRFASGLKRVDWGAILLACLLVYCLLSRPVSGLPGLSNVEDDVYYYVVIARHLLAGHGSTFNGLVATNGYHPLWLLVITAVQSIARELHAVIQAVYVLVCVSVLVTYCLARAIFRQFTSHIAVPELLAILVAVIAADFLQTGMEIVLAVPLALFLILQLLKANATPTLMDTAKCSLLTSLMILARLDAVFLALLLVFCLAFDSSLRRSLSWKHAAALFAGAAPLIFYFATNLLCFHTLMPVSGQAKQLRLSHHPSSIVFTWRWLNDWQRALLPLPVIGAAWLCLRYRRISVRERAILLAALLFPFAQFGALSVLSDWPSWPWYFYSFVIASCAALAVLFGDRTRPEIAGTWRARPLTVSLGVVAFFALLHLNHRLFRVTENRPRESVFAAEFVRQFAATHPGRYAMGDRAGIVGALIDQPLVQTEGLVMNKEFLAHIRNQDDIVDTLRRYGVRYYVATTGYRADVATAVGYGPPVIAGCFQVREPALAGPGSPKMRGRLCFPPVATYQSQICKTWIFDLEQAAKQAAGTNDSSFKLGTHLSPGPIHRDGILPVSR